MKHLHKKGVWSDIKEAVLAIAILCACLYLVWAYILHGIVPTQNTLQQCSALTGNGGVCKAQCDSTAEVAFPGLGCKGKTSLCCVKKNENMNDVILPSGYGGDTNYDFEVLSIDFVNPLPTGCQPDLADDATGKTIMCTPNRPYTISIQITIKNLYKPIDVYANPVVVLNGNGDNIIVGKFPGAKITLKTASTVTPEIPTADNENAITPIPGEAPEQIVTTNIKVTTDQTSENEFIDIYPYVMCDSAVCKKTDDPAMRGILNTNYKAMITVNFETKK
jgi:hypothetical protein